MNGVLHKTNGVWKDGKSIRARVPCFRTRYKTVVSPLFKSQSSAGWFNALAPVATAGLSRKRKTGVEQNSLPP